MSLPSSMADFVPCDRLLQRPIATCCFSSPELDVYLYSETPVNRGYDWKTGCISLTFFLGLMMSCSRGQTLFICRKPCAE